MYHDVCIPSYWRSELCVFGHPQGVVDDVLVGLVPRTHVPRLGLYALELRMCNRELGLSLLVICQSHQVSHVLLFRGLADF